jgi:hypothetical protein
VQNQIKLKITEGKLLSDTESALLAAFEDECKATAKKADCSNLLVRLNQANPSTTDKAEFAEKCKVDAPPGGEGGGGGESSGSLTSAASIALFILAFAFANFYFEL